MIHDVTFWAAVIVSVAVMVTIFTTGVLHVERIPVYWRRPAITAALVVYYAAAGTLLFVLYPR